MSFFTWVTLIVAYLGVEAPLLGVNELGDNETVSATIADSEAPSLTSEPLLPSDKPDWVAAADRLDGNIHRLSVATEPMDSRDACRAQIDSTILAAARRYVNEHVLEVPDADKLNGLTAKWVRENWLVPDREWEAVLNRSSGTYYQLWVELEVFPKDRELVKKWYQELETQRRSLLSLLFCLLVGATAGVANMGLRLILRKGDSLKKK